MEEQRLVAAVQQWIESTVIGLNLCPFARAPLAQGAVRFAVTRATTEEALLAQLATELQRLEAEPAIETSLLIHPEVLNDFYAYNAFLSAADALIDTLGFTGVFQLASFHPDYQFAGTEAGDAENYSNRSPAPMLHLLREASVEAAIAAHPDPASIPAGNIDLLNRMGREQLALMLSAYIRD